MVLKTGVLIIDSSKISRQNLRNIIESDPSIEVLGEASDAQEGLRIAQKKKPTVIIIDMSMPNKDGVTATIKIMAFCPTPIILLTSSTIEASIKNAFEALTCGASEVFEKPHSAVNDNSKFINLIKLVSQVKVITHLAGKHDKKEEIQASKQPKQNAILIAASTGGPNALKHVLTKLDVNNDAGIIIAQHIAKGFMPGLVSWLSQESKMKIKEAKAGDKLRNGLALFCPAGLHVKFAPDGSIRLVDTPYQLIKPSADVLFDSAAEVFGAQAIGIILTGMGGDGAQGLLKIKDYGGLTIAQDEKTCVVFGMPKKAIAINAVQTVLPLDKIGEYVNKLFRNKNGQNS